MDTVFIRSAHFMFQWCGLLAWSKAAPKRVRWNLLTGELLSGSMKDFAEMFGQTPQADTASRIHSIDGLDLTDKKGTDAFRTIKFVRRNRQIIN